MSNDQDQAVADPHPAQVAKWEAEARKADAEAEKERALAREAAAKADYADSEAESARIELDDLRTKRQRLIAADDYNDRRYRFEEPVADGSVTKCIKQLDAWHRLDPSCTIEIVFDSPGGGVIEGMHLFDHIRALSAAGHEITTIVRGYAASMAGILLQAGDVRVAGPESYVMIHEVSFGVRGKIGEVEDEVAFVKKIQDRVLDIFARRCQATDAPKKLTKAQLQRRWRRKDWWISSDEALAFGLVDEIR